MSDENLAVEAVKEAEAIPEDGKLTLSNGVVVKVLPIPDNFLAALYRKYPEPQPPIVEVETQGKILREPNPNDPTYLEKLQKRQAALGKAQTDLVLLRGIKVESMPEDITAYDDPVWAEEAQYLGMDVPEKDCLERKLLWMQYVVVPTVDDMNRIQNVNYALRGITEDAIVAAVERFQRSGG